MRTEALYREERHNLGIMSQLDQFLDTPHPLPQREAIARALGIPVTRLEALMGAAHTNTPKAALLARLNLNLLMAGAGGR